MPRRVRPVRRRRRGVPADRRAAGPRRRLGRRRPAPRLRAPARRRPGDARRRASSSSRRPSARARSASRPRERRGRDRPPVRRDAPPARARRASSRCRCARTATPARRRCCSRRWRSRSPSSSRGRPRSPRATGSSTGERAARRTRETRDGFGRALGELLGDERRARALGARARATVEARAHLGSLRGTARVRSCELLQPAPHAACADARDILAHRARTKHRGRRGRVALRARTRAGPRGAERHRGPGSLPQRRREDAGRRQALLRGDREQGPALLLHVRGRSRDRGLAGPVPPRRALVRDRRARDGAAAPRAPSPAGRGRYGLPRLPAGADERLVSRGTLDARRARVRAVDPVGLAPRTVRGERARCSRWSCSSSSTSRLVAAAPLAALLLLGVPEGSRLRHAVRAGGGLVAALLGAALVLAVFAGLLAYLESIEYNTRYANGLLHSEAR